MKLIAGNWKMNGLRRDAEAFAAELKGLLSGTLPDIVVCPPATLLAPLGTAFAGTPVRLGAQDCHGDDKGAHTGWLSAAMLKEAGCGFVIVGHSERRAAAGETDALVRAKAEAAHRHGLTAIVCVGETEAERKAGQALAVIERQLAGSVPAGTAVIAYEPVWAIGSGLTPTLAEIAEVHGLIKARQPGARALYGGSVKPANAREILGLGEVDGALVGGASLVAKDFWAICEACR